MAHLDLDPDDLAALAVHARDASGLLDGVTAGRADPRPAAQAAGDATLADAIRGLLDAWAPLHQDLRDTLGRLATGLDRAANLYGTAERITTDGIARSIGPATDGTA